MNLNDVHPCLLPVHVSRPGARAPRAAVPRDQPRARPDLPCPPAAPRPPLAGSHGPRATLSLVALRDAL